ncbi:MAG: DNA-directed RNA polymerase subunit omega [Rickettsiaceae bacterium]|nr:DNA-directed RNA polymerase subunit omega [Rickettsiaceae bacterium]
MARVTVEDCKRQVPNRFELVILAAQRAKKITSGDPLTIERDNDKDTVVSLREIAAGSITAESLRETKINMLRKNITIIEDEDITNDVTLSEEHESIEMAPLYDDNITEEDLEIFEEIDFEEPK